MTATDCFSPVGVFMFGALWVAAAVGLFVVPFDAVVPIHWDIHGKPDLFAPGWLSVLIMPVVGTLVAAVCAAAYGFSSPEAVRPGLHLLRTSLAAGLCLLFVLQVALILVGLGRLIDVPYLTAFAVGCVLMVIGNSLPKSQPNHIGGLRLPWTLYDEDNWRITHRWTGRLMMISGAALIIGILTGLQGTALIIAMLFAAILPVLAGIALSFIMAKC